MMLRAPLTYGVFTIMPRLTADSHAKEAGKSAPLPVLLAQRTLLQKLKQLMDVRSDAAYVLRQTMDEFL